MAPKSKQAKAVARPASPEFVALANAALVRLPRQGGRGIDVIELRRNPTFNSARCWVVRINSHPSFSISHRQLISPSRFRGVAVYQLLRRDFQLDHFLCDIVGLPVIGWCDIVERLIAALERGSGE
ncbi:hypothetical protein [Bradyrhizobium sp. JYMT SZCCT0180]|uniref:hypothetical protein n=1 Tax=Bradyrhizobium sp. JYMT SZCCT0180 TaxID=2807666 RepID=UPI001BAC50DE|nr:hypothetical protein [Bradyrhizobium sp. JYMT SZCCT0180]MBR1211333.1 hypothetical protein [Bradyrhizobium sp. JYMT SZCCT0180]